MKIKFESGNLVISDEDFTNLAGIVETDSFGVK